MKQRFNDLVTWITGGGTGIGKALAEAFGREGAIVVVSGRRMDRLEDVVSAIEATGGRATALVCDVNDDDSVDAAIRDITTRFGRLDVVVANAGFSVSGRIAGLSVEDWRRQFETNLFGVVRTVTRVLPALEKTGGRLALVGSVAWYLPVPGSGAYAASKAAIHSLGQTLSAELAGSGVSCTTIHPGFIESEIAQVDNEGRFDPERKDKRPQQLMWKAEDAARPMLDAIWRRRREAVITGHGRFAAFLGRHLPGLTFLIMSRQQRG